MYSELDAYGVHLHLRRPTLGFPMGFIVDLVSFYFKSFKFSQRESKEIAL